MITVFRKRCLLTVTLAFEIRTITAEPFNLAVLNGHISSVLFHFLLISQF